MLRLPQIARLALVNVGKHSSRILLGNHSSFAVLSQHQSPSLTLLRRASSSILDRNDYLHDRHIGPRNQDIAEMLNTVGASSLEDFMVSVIPESIRMHRSLNIGEPLTESQMLDHMRTIASQNKILKSFIGMGYYGNLLPTVIQRNLLENPNWYTSYTPYQAEVSQGRMESLLNWQTIVTDLTGLPVANASLLDEATAAAEAMQLSLNSCDNNSTAFFVDEKCHPQTIAVVSTRAHFKGMKIIVGNRSTFDFKANPVCGALFQYPDTTGLVENLSATIERVHGSGGLACVATDLLALSLLTPPGELGADIALGSGQRLGVPMGFGGPHAAFFAVRDSLKRKMPGRLIGVSKDSNGKSAMRLAMQTREQHIRRDKATSNICTAQALLANIAAMYCIYHGPDGMKRISQRIHAQAVVLRESLKRQGFVTQSGSIFDTVRVELSSATEADNIMKEALSKGMNLRRFPDGMSIGISVDETTNSVDLDTLSSVFAKCRLLAVPPSVNTIVSQVDLTFPSSVARASPFLTNRVFQNYQSELELTRYMNKLQGRDISLATSMIPLGSCTMKLNATTEMMPVTWPEFANIHPFAPTDQAKGYIRMVDDLSKMLCNITGFDAISLQPNSGAAGEFAGLAAITSYHESRQQGHRRVCLIPSSAHGTNPASAAMAGMKVIPVNTNPLTGDIDMADLKSKAEAHASNLSCLMVTYPSTFGKFEESIKEVCRIIHANGGQVYMDGANMNAQCGWTSPGDLGADVCHLNLHKTFCIPHGGGGPGVGPIGVVKHLAPFLPRNPVFGSVSPSKNSFASGTDAMASLSSHNGAAVSAAPFGSALILTISYAYIKMMGSEGIKRATAMAILNANYMAARLGAPGTYDVLYRGINGRCAHEFILDIRPFKPAGIVEEDVAKRLQDFGFHAPTMSWPVPGTLMIEPTESESKAELDRFIDSMLKIREEIRDVTDGKLKAEESPLKFAPHTSASILTESWNRKYSREVGAFPLQFVKENKFWPSVGRIDNVYGDRNLICSCPGMELYSNMTDMKDA